jgi:hypothetical protein
MLRDESIFLCCNRTALFDRRKSFTMSLSDRIHKNNERKKAIPEPIVPFPQGPYDYDEEDESSQIVALKRSSAVELKTAPGLNFQEVVAPSEPLVKQKRKSSSSSEPKSKKKTLGPSPWAEFLRKFQHAHPGMDMGESIIEARKRYIGPNGRPKSYEKTWKQVWQHRNPTWRTFGSPEEIKARMREDFLNKI